MAVKATFIFFCAGLTGILSITTVQHVSVEVGGTVQIPCQYEDKYKGHVKYLCWGYKWRSCEIKIRSDQSNSNKYSISDDQTQRIVTFTFNNLVSGDSDYYWCGVEINGRDDGEQFQLSVTAKGLSNLHVDSQWITGYFGGKVTINCRYRVSGSKQWCRVGGSCLRSSGQIDGAVVKTETRVSGPFAVTMTELRPQNIGWYWCSCGDLQMPVFLYLTERPTTTTTTTTTLSTLSTGTTNATSALLTIEREQQSVSHYIITAAIALSLLLLIVAVSLFIWCVLKRNMKKSKGAQSDHNEDVIYSDINHKKQPSNKKKGLQNAHDLDVIYSDVNHREQSSNKKRDNIPEEGVIYSNVKARNDAEQMTQPPPPEANVIYSTVQKK